MAARFARLEPHLRAIDMERDIPDIGDRMIDLLGIGTALSIYHLRAFSLLLEYFQGRLEIDLQTPPSDEPRFVYAHHQQKSPSL